MTQMPDQSRESRADSTNTTMTPLAQGVARVSKAVMRGRVSRTFAILIATPAVGLIVFVLLQLVSSCMGAVAGFLWLASTVLCGMLVFRMLGAKGRALSTGEADAAPGYLKFVAWNPTEGVVFLRNKIVSRIDDDATDGGGLELIFPVLGEELALRVPLEVQTLHFADTNVLTREYVPLGIKCTIYWRIVSLAPFYQFVSREVHLATDRGGHSVVKCSDHSKVEAAEQWLKHMAEEETRKVFSKVSTGLLLADRLAGDVGLSHAKMIDAGEYSNATGGLANAVFDAMNKLVAQYGLSIHRVALQEVELPPEICRAATEACRSFYLPLQAEREASASRLRRESELGTDVSILGKDAVGAREVLGAVPDGAFSGLAGFLDEWMKRGTTPAARLPGPPSAAT